MIEINKKYQLGLNKFSALLEYTPNKMYMFVGCLSNLVAHVSWLD